MSEIKKLQAVELDILKETARICEKHNIPYLIGQGTLLGAAKYKGFIPWDDDVDLLLPYKDLLRLQKIFPQEADPKYFFTNCFVEKHFPIVWSKVRNRETLSRPKRYREVPINWGICIDLFPVYPVSNIGFIRKMEHAALKAANKILLASFTKYEENHSAFVRLLEKVPICLRHLFYKFVIFCAGRHGDNTKYVLVSCKGFKIVERSLLYGEKKALPFEGDMYPVPSNYDAYLRLNYGDYMAPLPEHLQKGHELDLGDIEWEM